jgi:hypothetical protein
MNFASTTPANTRPSSASSPRTRATAATTTTNSTVSQMIGTVRSVPKYPKVAGRSAWAGMAASLTSSPARSPDSATPGGTSIVVRAPFASPSRTRTSTWLQPSGRPGRSPAGADGSEVITGQGSLTASTSAVGKVTPSAAN